MSRSIGNLLRVSSGMAGAQLISLIAIPFITRLYTPDDYGYLGAYTNIIAFLLIVATGRYHLALVVSQDDAERRQLVQVALLFLFGSTLLSLVIVAFLRTDIERWMGMPGLAELLWLWPLSNIMRGLFLLLQYWCTAHRLFGPLGASYAIEAVIGALVVIAAGLIIGSSETWPIIARVVAVTAASIILLCLIVRGWTAGEVWHYAKLGTAQLWSAISKYRRFPLLTSPAAILNTLALAGPPLILAVYFEPAVLAYFLIAERLLSVPLTIVGTSFGHVIYQEASERVGRGPLEPVLRQSLKRLFRIGYFALGLIAACGPTLFELALGQAWRQAGEFAQILALGAFFRLLAAPFNNVTATLGRQDIELRFNVLLAVGRNLAVVLGAHFIGLTGAVLLISIASALAYLYLLSQVFQLARASFLAVIADVKAEFLYQSILLLGVFLIEYYFGGYYTLLAVCIGTLTWLFLLLRFDPEVLEALQQRGKQSG